MVRNGTATKSIAGVPKCKALARTIKAQRTPPWPTIPTLDLPPKEIADQLVDCYLRTFESLYRVLHIPSFKRDYEALWEPAPAHRDQNQQPQRVDMAFMVQAKLVLAIGATVYDQDFSLRPSAIRWVYEALTFTSEPEFKSRLNFKSVQTDILLLLARETAGIGGNLVWISAGSLLRTAVYMGLHRDPAHLPKRTMFTAEMHRRLWNTVLELTVSCSMNAGAPPQISLDDYDTEPPGNYHDEQLVENPGDDESDFPGIVARPESEFTKTSVAIALRKIFPIRLAIAKFLNDLGSTRRQGDMTSAYNETLKLDADLRAAYRNLSRTIQPLSRDLSDVCWPGPGSLSLLFPSQFIDLVINRDLLALHVPFYSAALHEAAYAFSRRVVVGTCFRIWRAVNPQPTPLSSPDATRHDLDAHKTTNQDIHRLASHGAGFCRNAGFQTGMLLLGELRAQLREEIETSLSPVDRSLLRPDLLAMVTEAKDWALRSMNAGETNMKGYMFASMVSAQIEGMLEGLEGEEALAQLLVKTADEVVDTCVPLLEDMLEKETRIKMACGGEGDSGQTQGREQRQGEAGAGTVPRQQFEAGSLGGAHESGSALEMMSDWDILVSVSALRDSVSHLANDLTPALQMMDAQHAGDFGNIAEPMNWAFYGVPSFSSGGPFI